ncbi:unnamed protein product [Urochloa humidicola]
MPDWVNTQSPGCKKCRRACYHGHWGGMDAPVPGELPSLVDIFSPNETELARLTGMPTETFEQICQAAGEGHKMGLLQYAEFVGSMERLAAPSRVCSPNNGEPSPNGERFSRCSPSGVE